MHPVKSVRALRFLGMLSLEDDTILDLSIQLKKKTEFVILSQNCGKWNFQSRAMDALFPGRFTKIKAWKT